MYPYALRNSYLWATAATREIANQNVSKCGASNLAVRRLSDFVSVPSDSATRKKQKLNTDSYASMPTPPPANLPRPLVQDDIDLYLKPLYTRKWGIQTSTMVIHKEKTGIFLAKTFKFSGYDAVMSFLNDLAPIVQEENHHPDIAFDYNMVKFQTQTHCIVDPNTPSQSTNCEQSSTKARIPPGLTPNDARMAIRVEKLFADVYLADGRGRLHVQKVLETPTSIEEIRGMGKPKSGGENR